METLIVTCLLLVIALLLSDKIEIHTKKEQKQKDQKPKEKLPEIMGRPKPIRRRLLPKSATESQDNDMEPETDNFAIEIDDDADLEIPQGELDNDFRNSPDLEEEEEEWKNYGIPGFEHGFAQGVTFEELSSAGMLLSEEKLEASQKQTAIAIVQKIQGTELFNLLENSMESTSRKIAELLDGGLS